ncbi:MAG: squalene/phytoene synthase family protein [Pseudomonadota bacterium]
MQDYRFPNDATPPGSEAYYLVRFAPAPIRDDLAVLFAWRRELDRVLNISEPSVARMRLDWWQKQLHADGQGNSAHPLARNLFSAIERRNLDIGLVRAMMETQDERLRRASPADEMTLARLGAGVGGSWAELIWQSHDLGASGQASAGDYGTYFELARGLAGAGEALRRGMVPFADSMFAADRPGPEELLQDKPVEPILRWIDCVRQARPRHSVRGPRAVSALLGLADALLRVVEARPAVIYDAAVRLTPLRNLWLVWRAPAAAANSEKG